MALALDDRLAKAGGDLNDQTRRCVRWLRQGEHSVIGSCFDIGGATCAALSRFTQSCDALRSGDTAENSSGNGSIMRLAPVPIRNYLEFGGEGILVGEHLRRRSRRATSASLDWTGSRR